VARNPVTNQPQKERLTLKFQIRHPISHSIPGAISGFHRRYASIYTPSRLKLRLRCIPTFSRHTQQQAHHGNGCRAQVIRRTHRL